MNSIGVWTYICTWYGEDYLLKKNPGKIVISKIFVNKNDIKPNFGPNRVRFFILFTWPVGRPGPARIKGANGPARPGSQNIGSWTPLAKIFLRYALLLTVPRPRLDSRPSSESRFDKLSYENLSYYLYFPCILPPIPVRLDLFSGIATTGG